MSPPSAAPNPTLASLPIGALARIKSVDSSKSAGQRLMTMGLLPGIEVKLIRVAPFGDPLAIEFDGRRLSLRRREAAGVLLEPA
ncbi:MAG TPA: FeoA family protein [Verrucomicrobiales bacterium]|nr:FeoA family protein [Verrucomicrobiales bacterium]